MAGDIQEFGGSKMFDTDICLCASEECPKYKECIRGGKTEKEGIYTMSYLSEVCNQNNKYEYFIGEKE